MFYYLLYPLRDYWFGFNVFRYITFRAVLASITAFLISVFVGSFIIKGLRSLNIGEAIFRKDAPHLYPLHKTKEGTPTMGGLIMILAVVVSTLLWAKYKNRFVIMSLLVFLWLGFIGFLDDYIKLRGKSRGLVMTTKLIGQLIPAFLIGVYLYIDPGWIKNLDVPFFKSMFINLGIYYIFFVVLVIIATSNAVNITDGLDGLAVGCLGFIALTYAVFAYASGHIKIAHYLQIPYISGSGELTVFCAGIIGASLGFLWFNSYPATIFMGDTGSLSLGGVMGLVAVLVKKELVLPIVGGVFVAEVFSVILQIISFRLTGKRIFLMAPLHHHFQFKGIPESKITIRFWIVALMLAVFSLITLKLR